MKMKQNGSSLPEALIVVALMGGIAVVATIGMKHVSEEAKSKDLRKDIASLNRAVGVYLASGGSLMNPLGANLPEGVTTEEVILQKLKTTADSVQAEEINGFRGSMIDLRMTPVVHREDDGEPQDVLIVWNQSTQRFEIDGTARVGVKKFAYDELGSEEAREEVRSAFMKLAKVDDLIWDHAAQTIEVGDGPTYIGSTGGYGGSGGFTPEGPNQLKLDQPSYSQPGGLYGLKEFDKSITIANPNPAGTSQVVYSTNGGAWQTYQGETITIPLDSTLDAQAISIDPDHWIDSDMADGVYDGEPVQLDIEIETPQDSYSYAQVGGELIDSGSSPLPSAPDPALVRISNVQDYPVWLLEEAQVKAMWGRNDETFGNAPTGQIGGHWSSVLNSSSPDFEVDITIGHWTSEGLVLTAKGKSESGSKYVIESEIEAKTLVIDRTQLRSPVASIEGGIYTTNEMVQFRRDHEFGDTPKGARMFVTTDGSDPLGTDGNPHEGAIQV
ncbi:MAG: hypothetical protein P8J87_12110, partial [Verrucomicrobiales bacterium]|nr:hypothetical protein [Verrucomicrobiales bacterium]